MLTLYHTPFPTADALTWNVTTPKQPARQLRYSVYLYNFMITQEIMNSYEYKL